MLKGIYTAASGMSYQIDALNDVAGNLANVSTTGYKRTQLVGESFDNLVTQFAHPTANDKVGLGVREIGTARIESQGALIRTDNPLHMAISGDGYFQTQAADGRVAVTRNGDFRLDTQGFLVAQSGERVLGTNNQQIQLGVIATQDMKIRQDGTILAGNRPVGQLKVVGPDQANGPSFPASDIGAPQQAKGFSVEQGFLENSNVSVISEMVNMITINKAFSFGQKAITTQDNLLNKTVNDLGRLQ
ncbi:MAG: flgG [Cyanobacteria bacterium RYN_339]|nr:flgG [Cyanobacteria bacterium RYN_339]